MRGRASRNGAALGSGGAPWSVPSADAPSSNGCGHGASPGTTSTSTRSALTAAERRLKATIRVGGKETPFSSDDARAGLRADVGPVKGDHADAIVTITAPGGKPTPVGVSFHLESTAKTH